MSDGKRVCVALSGGKDSTAAVLLLRERGMDVHAVTMRLGIEGEEERLEKVERLACKLAVPWHPVDLQQEFQEKVISYFLSEYRQGRTPNPCMVCNRRIKFGLLLGDIVRNAGADFVATGHYAAIADVCGGRFLTEPRDKRKSQIYFLAQIGPAVLKHVMFPLSQMTLVQVREKVAGLPLANTEESQDVCFLAGKGIFSFLKNYIPEAFVPGDILDTEGRRMGRHEGVIHYTVGQRRGTRFAAGKRVYVIRTDVEKRTVILGGERYLLAHELTGADPAYWKEVRPGERYRVKIRYQHEGEEAKLLSVTPESFRVRFVNPVRAVTPGQFAVLYDEDRIVASAAIA